MSARTALRSMTGFGRGRIVIKGRPLTLELSSVNHRNLQIRLGCPEEFATLERRIRREISRGVHRGSVTCTLHFTPPRGGRAAARIDGRALADYIRQIRDIQKRLRLDPTVRIEPLLSLPGVIQGRASEPADMLWGWVRLALQMALRGLAQSRISEGCSLARALLAEIHALEADTRKIERLSPTAFRIHRRDLRKKLAAMAGDVKIRPQDLAREAALAAERADVTEETQRIHSHCRQFREGLSRGGPVGRHLEFLAQELARETNTLTSKSHQTRILTLALAAKLRVEKLREQTVNLE